VKLRFVLGLLGLTLAACGGEESAEPIRVGDLEIRAELAPEAPRVGKNQLEIVLRDAEGRAVEGAELSVKVHMHAMGAMPAMGGPAATTELGGGRYRADFDLAMGGTWIVELSAKPPGGERARAEGSLTVGAPGVELTSVGGAPPAASGHGHGAAPAAGEPGGPGEAPGELRLAPERLQRIGVRTVRAERRAVSSTIRAAGRVAWDETALADVSLKVSGWVRELRVAATGSRVERGEVLFTVYSPELYAAQREYLLALAAQARARESGTPDRADYLVTAAKNRLRLWDVAAGDLARIAQSGAPLEAVPIRSPASGYVLEKSIVEGGAVEPGARLYRIAPLDRVWVEAEVYEAELAQVTIGMDAVVTLAYLPGRRFSGRVAWLSPGLSSETRTARVRIELQNPDLALRPDMLASVELAAPAAERLLVPLSAVLYAGKRSFVFLDLGEGRLRPAPVAVGVRSGEEIEILSGIEPGQSVVSSATFLVASESRLRAALDQW
jgi:Cu(I)/Ag(I) efflux system membrane fusion protein